MRLFSLLPWITPRLAGDGAGAAGATGTPATPDAQATPGAIEIRDLAFRYQGRDTDTLHSLNLSIPAGQSVGIVGVNGAGKSTLMSLIAGLEQPTSGSITISGRPVAIAGEAAPQIAVIFQEFSRYPLDVRAEAEIFDDFLDVTGGVTTLLVSHRLSSVRRADRIVVLENGRITEDGTHEELMARGFLLTEIADATHRWKTALLSGSIRTAALTPGAGLLYLCVAGDVRTARSRTTRQWKRSRVNRSPWAM